MENINANMRSKKSLGTHSKKQAAKAIPGLSVHSNKKSIEGFILYIDACNNNKNDCLSKEVERRDFEKYIETSPDVSQGEKEALARLSERERRILFY